MTKAEQRKLFEEIVNTVRDSLLARSDRWPENWDGHELRELAAEAFQNERTRAMREARSKRRRDCLNDIAVHNLY